LERDEHSTPERTLFVEEKNAVVSSTIRTTELPEMTMGADHVTLTLERVIFSRAFDTVIPAVVEEPMIVNEPLRVPVVPPLHCVNCVEETTTPPPARLH
jgi:hypothetical protein